MNRFKLAPTSLSTFINCPMSFKGSYVTHEVQYKQSPEQADGIRIHRHLELGLGRGMALPPELQYMEPIISTLRSMPGSIHTEVEMAVNENGTACDWKAKDAFQRAKADAVIVNGKSCLIIDWKTGKRKTPEALKRFGTDIEIQSDMLNITAAAKYGATNVTTMFIYTGGGAEGELPAIVNVYRHGTPEYESVIRRHTSRVHDFHVAWSKQEFNPKPGGLCSKYCEVRSCIHNGEYGK